eukprot:GHRQ01024009.1.p2 GENE.GHRQ01024009.1~~GHRQ01024009.1.p2  ORF type:complete len:133 (-),score=25.80 GHRQ01024009.1:1108-1506(-)
MLVPTLMMVAPGDTAATEQLAESVRSYAKQPGATASLASAVLTNSAGVPSRAVFAKSKAPDHLDVLKPDVVAPGEWRLQLLASNLVYMLVICCCGCGWSTSSWSNWLYTHSYPSPSWDLQLCTSAGPTSSIG